MNKMYRYYRLELRDDIAPLHAYPFFDTNTVIARRVIKGKYIKQKHVTDWDKHKKVYEGEGSFVYWLWNTETRSWHKTLMRWCDFIRYYKTELISEEDLFLTWL